MSDLYLKVARDILKEIKDTEFAANHFESETKIIVRVESIREKLGSVCSIGKLIGKKCICSSDIIQNKFDDLMFLIDEIYVSKTKHFHN